MQFETIVGRWQEAQRENIDARLAYECVHAEALAAAAGKTAEVREAQADLEASDAHRVAKHLAVEAQAFMHQLVYLRSAAATATAVGVSADSDRFEHVIAKWCEAQHDAMDAWLHHESEYARALIGADGKSAELRKAQAKLLAMSAQRKAEHATVVAQALLQLVLYLRSCAGPVLDDGLLVEAGISAHHGAAA